MTTQPQRGKCPFNEKRCSGQDCHLWTPMDVVKLSQLAPVGQRMTVEGCVFHLMLDVLQHLTVPRPPAPGPGPISRQ